MLVQANAARQATSLVPRHGCCHFCSAQHVPFSCLAHWNLPAAVKMPCNSRNGILDKGFGQNLRAGHGASSCTAHLGNHKSLLLFACRRASHLQRSPSVLATGLPSTPKGALFLPAELVPTQQALKRNKDGAKLLIIAASTYSTAGVHTMKHCYSFQSNRGYPFCHHLALCHLGRAPLDCCFPAIKTRTASQLP